MYISEPVGVVGVIVGVNLLFAFVATVRTLIAIPLVFIVVIFDGHDGLFADIISYSCTYQCSYRSSNTEANGST